MKSSLREKIIISYENYQNNGYMNSCLKEFYPMSKTAYHYSCDIEKIINKRGYCNDFSEYVLYYIYSVLATHREIHPHHETKVSIDRFLDNFLENNPFIFIDERKEINLYHLLMLLANTHNFNNKSLGKILMRISVKDVFSYVSYIHETRLKRNFNTKHVNYEYTYLMLLLSDFCLRGCEDKLSYIYKDNDKVDLDTLNYSIISHIKNKDIDKYEINESLIAIYTKYIDLIDKYFIKKTNKSIFKKWFYAYTIYGCYRTKFRINNIMHYLFKFNNDYFDEFDSSDIPDY